MASCFVCLLAPAAAGTDPDSNARQAWVYSSQGSERAYIHLGSGEWLGTHPSKPPATLTER